MGKRTRVGILYVYNEKWIGGTYYILNLIRALNHVEDEKKPEIVLLTEEFSTVNEVKEATQYPYLDYLQYPIRLGIVKRGINKVFSSVGVKPFSNVIKNPNIDLFYPKYPKNIRSEKLKKIYWIPDFQEEHLPELFTESQLQNRRRIRSEIARKADFLVFSSKNSQSDFNRFYAGSKAEQFVLNFAVTHPDLNGVDEGQVLSKYGLDRTFYYIPNQFWVHKNHITVLKALKELKQEKKNILFVFSGKEHDHRSKDYFQSLKSYVADNKLEDNVKFLGFLPREDQLIILKNCMAVIQPSLFEGWSTVVEDAKAQNKFLFLSDLPIHKEQAKENCIYFERLNPNDLAAKILQTKISVNDKDYTLKIEQFGKAFMNIIDKTT